MNDDNKMKVILVQAGGMPVKRTYVSLNAILAEIGVKKGVGFETALFNDGAEPYHGIGIVSHDQDNAGRRKQNMLGLKGHFVIMGMERLDPDSSENPHMFTGLTEDQIKVVMKALARETLLNRN